MGGLVYVQHLLTHYLPTPLLATVSPSLWAVSFMFSIILITYMYHVGFRGVNCLFSLIVGICYLLLILVNCWYFVV